MSITGEMPTRTISSGGATGSTEGGAGVRKVSVGWPDDLFNAINRAAKKNRSSFAQEARRLCVLGLRHEGDGI